MKGYKIGFSEFNDDGDHCLCRALIELEIPENYPGLKCYEFIGQSRSNVARVLKINKLAIVCDIVYGATVIVTQDRLDSAFSMFDPNFSYRPGEIIYPDRFEDQPIICTNGIHFFTYRQHAINYAMNDWVSNRFIDCALEKKILHPIAVER